MVLNESGFAIQTTIVDEYVNKEEVLLQTEVEVIPVLMAEFCIRQPTQLPAQLLQEIKFLYEKYQCKAVTQEYNQDDTFVISMSSQGATPPPPAPPAAGELQPEAPPICTIHSTYAYITFSRQEEEEAKKARQ